jgi:hypothetical protein
MQPPIGLLTPPKAGIGKWLGDFHAKFFEPDTPANVEWKGRELPKAIVWAPGRMVDQVDSMLSSWQRNDNEGVPSTSAKFPVLFVAVAPDVTESPGEAGRQVQDWTPIAFPQDPEQRSFRVRTVGFDLRTQVVAVAPDKLSAMSLIGQLALYAVNTPRAKAPFVFSGFATEWPITILGGDRMAIPNPVGEQLCILTLDLTVRATVPQFRGPRDAEFTDGLVPPGFAVVQAVEAGHDMSMGPPTGVCAEEWAHFRRLVSSAVGPAEVVLDLTAECAARGR